MLRDSALHKLRDRVVDVDPHEGVGAEKIRSEVRRFGRNRSQRSRCHRHHFTWRSGLFRARAGPFGLGMAGSGSEMSAPPCEAVSVALALVHIPSPFKPMQAEFRASAPQRRQPPAEAWPPRSRQPPTVASCRPSPSSGRSDNAAIVNNIPRSPSHVHIPRIAIAAARCRRRDMRRSCPRRRGRTPLPHNTRKMAADAPLFCPR